MKRAFFAIAVVTAVLSGCAYVPKTHSERDLKAKQFIASSGKSSIYIFRKKRFSSGLSIPLLVDGKFISQSEPYTYFLVDVDPGQHIIKCVDDSNDYFMLTTKPDQIYFVKQVMKNGFSSVSCKFQEVTATEGKDAINGCDMGQNNQ